MKLSNVNNINHLWGTLIVEELNRCGIDYFCISPGSRSAPLVAAVADNKKIKSCVHYDERGLAYHALGYTASTGKPVCLISTSGTAAANFFPAIIEASKKKLPLIVLTADRPPELRNTGENQTIDQVKIYGDYVRFAFDLPCPSENIVPEMVLTTVDQAIYRSKGNPSGPVHINCMFREPLAPLKDEKFSMNSMKFIKKWMDGNSPFTTYVPFQKRITRNELEHVAEEINRIKKIVIVVGKLKTEEEQKSVIKLARRLDCPIFPDITSGLRLGSEDKNIIHYFDQILVDLDATIKYAPDGVIHLGGRMTSKRWYEFIEKVRPDRYIMVLNHPLRNDPLHNVSFRIESSVSEFCNSIKVSPRQKKSNSYVSILREASDNISRIIKEIDVSKEVLTVLDITKVITNNTFCKTDLFLAGSMSIRIMDMFAGVNKSISGIGSNRGASGIDGIIATAAGFAEGGKMPNVLLIGDLAFLHDINSLALIKETKYPFVIVVINDDGGGIFSFLPVALCSGIFEKYFATPHGFNFEMASKMYGITYVNPLNKVEFGEQYQKALENNFATIIELKMNRNDNFKFIKKLQEQIVRKNDAE